MGSRSTQLLKHSKDVITGQLVMLFSSIWRELEVSDAWKKGIIAKLSKKGSPSDCNNWRGITQLLAHGYGFHQSVAQQTTRRTVPNPSRRPSRLQERSLVYRTNLCITKHCTAQPGAAEKSKYKLHRLQEGI